MMNERLNRIAREPWMAEAKDILAIAEHKGVKLGEWDIRGVLGAYTVGGVEWYVWLALEEPSQEDAFFVEYEDTETEERRTKGYLTELDAVRGWNAFERYVNTRPLTLTTSALRRQGVTLTAEGVDTRDGAFVVGGMTLSDWSTAMTAE
ncbi:hypothetical protein [Streptomyces althioticus]|uniref:hypothetical protein n=1 Tax=Streptomyces althioticus TaxID=83380 RepID=UPI0033CE4568